MGTTLNAHFWTLFTLLLTAGTVLTVVATLAAEALTDRPRTHHRTPLTHLRQVGGAPRVRPQPLHHAHH
jgi:hypothetical protein